MKGMAWFAGALALLLGITAQVSSIVEDTAMSEPVLLTAYRQLGWGDQFEAGIVDDQGVCWYAEGHWMEPDFPKSDEALASWAKTADIFEEIGRFDDNEMLAIDSLIAGTEPAEIKEQSYANDAGTERAYCTHE